MTIHVAMLFVLLIANAAWAGPPFVTNDPGTPDWHGWEINFALTFERAKNQDAWEIPLIDINYGLLPNVQLKAEVPFAYVHPDNGGHESGLGDAQIGIKWRFVEEGDWRPQLAVYPQMTLPTGDSARGRGAGRPSYLVPIIGQKTWGKWFLYANLGYAVQTAEDSSNYWYSGAVLNRDISDRLSLGVELYGNSKKEVEGDPEFAFNIGGELSLTDQYRLLFSAGRSLQNGPSLTVYLGLQVLIKGWSK